MEPFSIVAPTASLDGYECAAESLILAATRYHGANIKFIEYDWRDARYTDPALFDLAGYANPIRESLYRMRFHSLP